MRKINSIVACSMVTMTTVGRKLILMLTISIGLAGCSNFQSLEAQAQSRPQTNKPVTASNASASPSSQQAYNQFMAIYKKYKGTPYKYGGVDRRGFDCSGFIGVAYAEGFNIKLPRTTESIVKNGTHVRRDKLKVGDIVIFKTSQKQLHAGVYTGNNNFIHASTSKGVIESSLSNEYWRTRYTQARRYL